MLHMAEEPSPPELPDWIGKVLGVLALLVLLMAVFSVAVVLLPRLAGFF